MPDKTQPSYCNAFIELKKLIDIKPELFVIDFELALYNSLIATFNVNIYACAFHFGQSIYRNMQMKSLTGAYKYNSECKMVFKTVLNHVCVPVDKVKDHYLYTEERSEDLEVDLVSFFEFVKKYYRG